MTKIEKGTIYRLYEITVNADELIILRPSRGEGQLRRKHGVWVYRVGEPLSAARPLGVEWHRPRIVHAVKKLKSNRASRCEADGPSTLPGTTSYRVHSQPFQLQGGDMADSADFEYCDVVMKGGITSGIVYPMAISELASRFKFKNIGGTSAGAIAAALTAAAEYRRRSGYKDAFTSVAGLPAELGSNGLLLKLFQPSAATRRTFKVALSALPPKSGIAKAFAVILSLVRNYFFSAVLGALAGALLPVLLFLRVGGSLITYAVLGLLWALLGAVAGMLIASVGEALRSITSNGFGLVSGFDPKAAPGGPPLTNWLHERVQKAAGRKVEDAPLTFADLWQAQLYDGETLKTDRTINLQMVTSGITQGRPYSLPFQTNIFYFDEEEFRGLFPAAIVDWLKNSPKPPPAADRAPHEVVSRNGRILRQLPLSEYTPIVVAARMSLSFPVLLSAVPLYAVDFTFKANQDKTAKQLTADRCWFSDGGIASNFPIQFFDPPLPRWPTFGITLKSPHPEHTAETDMVFLPKPATFGAQIVWNTIDGGGLPAFFGAIVNTMQNWHDNLQASAPDYRDRIVQISLNEDEGGLNLTMPKELLGKLSGRGKAAGVKLREDFDFSTHMWARFRILMCSFQRYLESLNESWMKPVPQDDEARRIIMNQAEPKHYKCSPELRLELKQRLEELLKLSQQGQEDMCSDGSPRPEPLLRAEPKF